MCSEPKKIVFSFCLLKLVFGYSALSTKHKLLKNPNSDATHIQPTPTAPHSISPKLSNTMGSQFFDRSKLINQKSLKQKEQKFGHVSGLKPFQWLKQDYMLQFFLEILQAVYLGFVHIPKLGSIPFQTIELKLVQRCGSHMEAQSCKASYAF